MPDVVSKTQLRARLRQRRRALSDNEQQTAAQALTAHAAALPAWETAQRIALYLSADGEIATTALAGYCRDLNKQLYLPVINPTDFLHFARWQPGCQLTRNRYDIPEPPASAGRCPAAELDIIFLPLVGWDRQGGRLGMGGGFYDRTLAGVEGPLLVGLAHASQETALIPREEWDIPLDFVITDAALHRCRGQD